MKLVLASIAIIATLTGVRAQESEKLTKTAIKDIDTEWKIECDYDKFTRYDLVMLLAKKFADQHYTDETERDIYLHAAKMELDRLVDLE